MANLTNVSGEPLELAIAVGGRDYRRVVEPDETVDISDYMLTGHVWPAATWRIDGTDVVQLVGDAYLAPAEPEPLAEPAVPAPQPAPVEEGDVTDA